MARHNEILSQEEVDALINGGAQEENALDEAPVEAGGVRDYDLANPERTVRSRLPTLELINERFTRRLRPAMHAYLRQNPDIFTGTTRILKYSEFLRNLVVPANLNIVQLSPLNGVGLIVYEPSLVFAAVENLFGGDGRYHVRVEGRDFTPTEQRIIESLVAITIKEYQSAWAPVYPLTLEYLRSEVSAQFANILSPAELVLTSTFNFEIGPTVSAMHVCLPYASLEPIRNILSTTHAAGDASPDERWIRALKQQLRHAEVEISVPFAKLTTQTMHLMKLKVGDVIAMDLPEYVHAEVEGVPLLECRYGTANGRYALKVEHINNITEDELATGD
jgi:flagellar motor switch protein FliM